MPSHLDYIAVRQRHYELARQAERARQVRDGDPAAPPVGERRAAVRLFARLRVRRPAEAPASSR